jgi:1,4-dihydroxy-2-naphthoyl-CoA synthase
MVGFGSCAQCCSRLHATPSCPELETQRKSLSDLIGTVEDGVATLTLNRPENLNALSDQIPLGLLESIRRLDDKTIGCIVPSVAGRDLCAGGDVKTMGSRSAKVFEERAAGIAQSRRTRRLHRRSGLRHRSPTKRSTEVRCPDLAHK